MEKLMQLLHKASSQFGRVLILLNQNWGKEKQMKQMKNTDLWKWYGGSVTKINHLNIETLGF